MSGDSGERAGGEDADRAGSPDDASSGDDAARANDPDDAGSSDAASSDDWREQLEAAGELGPEVVAAILEEHGDRGRTAIDAVGEGRVKEYRDFPVVVGHSDEYVVEDGACTCKDATYNIDPDDPTSLCWHALALEIARRVDAIDSHDMYYTEVRDLV